MWLILIRTVTRDGATVVDATCFHKSWGLVSPIWSLCGLALMSCFSDRSSTEGASRDFPILVSGRHSRFYVGLSWGPEILYHSHTGRPQVGAQEQLAITGMSLVIATVYPQPCRRHSVRTREAGSMSGREKQWVTLLC